METIEAPVIKQFKNMERREPMFLDSSARSELKRCSLAFFYRYILGLTPTGPEPSYFLFGRCVHRMFESWEQFWKADKPAEVCTALALREAMLVWGDTKDQLPDSQYSFHTKRRLTDTCMLVGGYLEQEKSRNIIKVLHTELPFNIQLKNGITVTGRFDQIIDWRGRIWGRDFKTTSKSLHWYKQFLYPSDQFCTYTVAESVLVGKDIANSGYLSGQLVVIIYNAKDTKSEKKGPLIDEAIITIPSEALDRWQDEVLYWEGARTRMRELDLYPANEKSCTSCDFHPICSLPKEEDKQRLINAKYQINRWDPTRGE